MPTPSTNKSMVGMQILPIVQPHTDKPYSTPDKVRATIMCSLIKRFITGVGLASPTPIVNAHRGLYVVMFFIVPGIPGITSLRIERSVAIIGVVSTDRTVSVVGRNILGMAMQRHLFIS